APPPRSPVCPYTALFRSRQERVLSARPGRQRSADRAPVAELLRRDLRSQSALLSGLPAAGEGTEEFAGLRQDLTPELHRTVREALGRGRAGLRGSLPLHRPVRGLELHVPDDRR